MLYLSNVDVDFTPQVASINLVVQAIKLAKGLEALREQGLFYSLLPITVTLVVNGVKVSVNHVSDPLVIVNDLRRAFKDEVQPAIGP